MSAAREGLRALELQYGEVGRIATTAGEEMDELVAGCEWWLSTHPEGEAMRDVCRAALTKVRGFT